MRSKVEHSANGCVESGSYVGLHRLDETVEGLVPAVSALLQRMASRDTVASDFDEAGYRFSVPLHFPDAIGRGQVVARLFRYRDSVRLDVEIVHNRVFARSSGAPSDRRCYMNDFVASVTVPADTAGLPEDFERGVLRGVRAARDAVQRHNRAATAPWNQITVTAID